MSDEKNFEKLPVKTKVKTVKIFGNLFVYLLFFFFLIRMMIRNRMIVKKNKWLKRRD